jgi:hypothetical protein
VEHAAPGVTLPGRTSMAHALRERAFTSALMVLSTAAMGRAPTWVTTQTTAAPVETFAADQPRTASRECASVASPIARKGGAAAMVVAGNAAAPAGGSAKATATVTTTAAVEQIYFGTQTTAVRAATNASRWSTALGASARAVVVVIMGIDPEPPLVGSDERLNKSGR